MDFCPNLANFQSEVGILPIEARNWGALRCSGFPPQLSGITQMTPLVRGIGLGDKVLPFGFVQEWGAQRNPESNGLKHHVHSFSMVSWQLEKKHKKTGATYLRQRSFGRSTRLGFSSSACAGNSFQAAGRKGQRLAGKSGSDSFRDEHPLVLELCGVPFNFYGVIYHHF